MARFLHKERGEEQYLLQITIFLFEAVVVAKEIRSKHKEERPIFLITKNHQICKSNL